MASFQLLAGRSVQHAWKQELRVAMRSRRFLPLRCRSTSAFLSAAEIRRQRIPQDQPLPGVLESATTFTIPKMKTQISTLENGMRVATETTYGQFSSVALFVKMGAKYEGGFKSGVSHVLEKIAFQGSKNFPTKEDVTGALEQYGGTVDCQIQRDFGMYTVSVLNDGVERAVEVLADAALQPVLSKENIADAHSTIQFYLQDLAMELNQDARLTDLIHKAALGNGGLGLPRLCPEENLPSIDTAELASYLDHCMQPSCMTLAAVNVPHDVLVEFAQKNFIGQTPSWTGLAHKRDMTTGNVFDYQGGIVLDHRDRLERLIVHTNQLPDRAHYAIGFKSVAFDHKDFLISCVLSLLLGGGTSFSAGGPGKGLFSRLYRNVLAQYPYIDYALSLHHTYADGGLLSFFGSCPPPQIGELANVFARECGSLAYTDFEQEEVDRAKNMLLSILFLNMELRAIRLEDIGRQVLETGKRESVEEIRRKISNVSREDVTRVARQIVQSEPCIAALGNLSSLPPSDQLKEIMQKGKLKPKRSWFM